MITPWISDLKSETLDQNVHIDATFPNVTNYSEIETAFDNLINFSLIFAVDSFMNVIVFHCSFQIKSCHGVTPNCINTSW